MKKLIYFLLLLSLNSYSQNFFLKQEIDSINFKKICPAIKNSIVNQQLNYNKNDTLFLLLNTDSANIFKYYSTCFDCFFELGLNLNYPLPKPLPRNSRMSLDSIRNQEFRRQSIEIDPYDLFILFINIKKYYEANYCNLSDKVDIPNLIKIGLFSHPISVQNLLLCKYRHITKEKMHKDLRSYHSKNLRSGYPTIYETVTCP